MRESAACFHNLEWPTEGARLAGPVVWLRGWIVGKPGHDFIDVRVRHAGGTHLGVLGLPRTDLAAHFKASRSWLPAEFILGVPVGDGPVSLTLEVMNAHGGWHALQSIALTIAPDGTPPPRVEGRLELRPEGTWTVRDAHHPFHGHLDDPGPTPTLAHGRAEVFGWLLDETRPLAAVLATTDSLVFNHLAHSLTDEKLAAKVAHPGATRARLRGPVDCPATLVLPACLRVYAVSPDGSVHLCFAQRIRWASVSQPQRRLRDWSRDRSSGQQATPTPVADMEIGDHPKQIPAGFPAIAHQPLPALPSGRPRRLLMVVRSLLPNDATLRALDLALHLVSSHRWAARLVAAEDGPLRRNFEAANVESLVVNPGPLFAAGDAPALEHALRDLQRQILWQHLDAVAVFDPVCGWAITLARRQGIPVLFDCSEVAPLEPDPTASPAVQNLLRESWRSASAICFASHSAARAQQGRGGNRPAEIILPWHTPVTESEMCNIIRYTLPGTGEFDRLPTNASAKSGFILAPLRTVDWLARQHPATVSRWVFRQGPAGQVDAERLAQQDDAFNFPALQRTNDWSVAGAALCLGPLFDRGPLRPVIDAAAAGIPVVAPRVALTEEIFHGTRVQLVDEANPLALAHALLAWAALPDPLLREASAIAPAIRARHDPAHLLPQWERLLATVVAGRG